jgi:hypothetical protein
MLGFSLPRKSAPESNPALTFCDAIGLGVKFEDYVAQGFGGLAVDQCGLVAPLVEGFGNGSNEIRRTENWFYVFDLAVGRDPGFDADGIDGAGWEWGSLWIGPGNQLADHYLPISMEGPSGVCRRH